MHGVLFDVGSMEFVIQRSLDARANFGQMVDDSSLRRKECHLQATSPMSSPPGSPDFIETQHHHALNAVGGSSAANKGSQLGFHPGQKSQARLVERLFSDAVCMQCGVSYHSAPKITL